MTRRDDQYLMSAHVAFGAGLSSDADGGPSRMAFPRFERIAREVNGMGELMKIVKEALESSDLEWGELEDEKGVFGVTLPDGTIGFIKIDTE